MMNSVRSVLLVDDDQDYKYFFFKALEKVDSSISVTTASDGREGIDKLKVIIPDIIILDFNMPRMNGLSFLKNIKSNKELLHIPVVIYSTFIGMFDLTEIKSRGAVHVYTKPIGFNETVNTVKEILQFTASHKNCA